MVPGRPIRFAKAEVKLMVTYFILKLTFQAIMEECNRMANEAQNAELARSLKSKVVQLDIDFTTGAIDEDEYAKKQTEIVGELRRLSGGGSIGTGN